MATPTIDQSFIEEFEAGVHLAYQRMGSKLRGTVRTKNNVKNKTTFQKVGKGSATQKSRHGEIPPMNLDHSNVSVTLADWFAGEWIDEFDTLRINHDEKMVAMESGAAALGRKTDDMLLTAMETTTTTSHETSNGATLAWAMGILETMGNNDVPDDGNRYVVVGWENWTQLLDIDEFAQADYVGADNLPFVRGTQAKSWLSFYWIPFSGLGVIDTDDNQCYAWHKSAVGHAIGADVSTNAQYYNTKDSWFVQNKMQMEAVLIDANGCISCDLKQ